MDVNQTFTLTNFLLMVTEKELLFMANLTLTLLELKVISHWSVQTQASLLIFALIPGSIITAGLPTSNAQLNIPKTDNGQF